MSELADRITRTSRMLRRATIEALRPLGLTPGQQRALLTIARGSGPVRMGELAHKLDIVPRSATTVVDALEAADLISRAVDPENRRSILLSLTDRGQAVQAQMSAARTRAANEILGQLTTVERAELARLLDLMQLPESRMP